MPPAVSSATSHGVTRPGPVLASTAWQTQASDWRTRWPGCESGRLRSPYGREVAGGRSAARTPAQITVMDALLELFSFQGRVNRQRYALHIILDDLFIFSMFIALVMVGSAIGLGWVLLPLAGVLIGAVVAATAVTVKRLHDIGRSGWHWLGFMVPIYNIYLTFLLLFKEGTHGPNRFGPDPLRPFAQLEYSEDVSYLEQR